MSKKQSESRKARRRTRRRVDAAFMSTEELSQVLQREGFIEEHADKLAAGINSISVKLSQHTGVSRTVHQRRGMDEAIRELKEGKQA